MPRETVLPQLGLSPDKLEKELEARGRALRDVLHELADLLQRGTCPFF
jgi:hypothetical protein